MARILVVEDDNAMRALITRYLTTLGYDWAECTNGEQGLLLAQKESFDVVLCDVQMPNMDGVLLARKLREVTPDTPVVMLSSVQDLRTAVSAIREGAVDFISKETLVEELESRLGQALGRRQRNLAIAAQQHHLAQIRSLLNELVAITPTPTLEQRQVLNRLAKLVDHAIAD